MSSHHIVREKQEPALYIHELANFNPEFLGQLLEWSPTVLVAANEYEKVNSLGLKIDFVVGNAMHLILQENTRQIIPSTEALFEVFDYLVANNYMAVNVVTSQYHFDDFTCFLAQLNIVLFTEERKHFAIRDGFSFWKAKHTRIWIDLVAYFEVDNLVQEAEDVFVVAEDGMVRFSFSTPYLFIGEYL
jgi:thiamine pyrophosphokinase